MWGPATCATASIRVHDRGYVEDEAGIGVQGLEITVQGERTEV